MADEEEVRRILREPKVLCFPLPESKNANNHTFLEVFSPIQYPDGTDFPGLRFHATWKRSPRPGRCNTKLTLQLFEHGQWVRIFQIEVYEKTRKAHRFLDGTAIYGPEIQYGKKHRPIRTKLDCNSDIRFWMRRFIRHTHIRTQRVEETLFKWDLEP